MRYRIYRRGGYDLGAIGETGGETDGEVTVKNDPVSGLEASTKSYTDNKLTSIASGVFTAGSVALERLPSFTGDVLKTQGGLTTSGLVSNIVPGTYAKVLVNAKGIIHNSSSLDEMDVPNLDWSKITSDKPTTLEGYGIVNALTVTGGTMTGPLSIGSVPNDPTAFVNKTYTDGQGVAGIVNKTGSIVYRTSSVTPNGYLRCNGGELSKTLYPELFQSLGYSHVIHPNDLGQPWVQQWLTNTTQTATTITWSTGTALPVIARLPGVCVTKNRVYLLGGSTNNIYTAPINTDGTLGIWVLVGPTPGSSDIMSCLVVRDKLYAISYGLSFSFNYIYHCNINVDGTLDTANWVLSNPNAIPILSPSVALIKNRIYFIGGTDSGWVSLPYIYYASIKPDGTLDDLIFYGSLPEAKSYGSLVITDNYLYYIGGLGISAYSLTTHYAVINADGTLGSWVAGTSLPAALGYSASAVVKNRVYLFGGYRGTAPVASVYSAPINANGIIGTWVAGTSLPAAIFGCGLIATSSRLYLLGGSNASTAVNIVRVATFTGGLNDYSKNLNEDTFNLPIVNSRLPRTQAYIKY